MNCFRFFKSLWLNFVLRELIASEKDMRFTQREIPGLLVENLSQQADIKIKLARAK